MKLIALIFLPYLAVWLVSRKQRRIYLWLCFMSIAFVQLFSLLPAVAVAYNVYAQANALNNAAVSMGRIYNSYQVTQSTLHGLPGWEGVDIKAGCGYPIYAPFAGTITYKGLDGYTHVDDRGVVYDQNTMMTLAGENGMTLTLLHGDYRVSVGDEIIKGDLLGYESSIGWSTGCHSHVILKDENGRTLNFLNWQVSSINKQDKPLKISWYDPARGGINCDSDCSTMASGIKVTSARYGNTAACIRSWMGKTVVIEGVGSFTCLDTGGAIVEHPGFIWIDLMLREPIVPFGTLVYEWELIER